MSTGAPYRIALVQMRCDDTPENNLARALDQVAAAARQGAHVVCLPELFRTPYFCKAEESIHFELAEPIPGPTTYALAAAARTHRVVVLAPVFERRAAGVYHNSVVILDADGSTAGMYRKMHIPDDPFYYEKFYFAPGDLGFRAFHTQAGAIGALICWDQWYPEAARLTALRGAEVLFYPTAIGWLPEDKASVGEAQRDAWRTVQRGHAIANGVYVAAVNRTGFEPGPADGTGIEFWGSSFICDPQGRILAEAPVAEEHLLIAEVDPARVEAIRRAWPFLRDRRLDAYQGLTQRFLDTSA